MIKFNSGIAIMASLSAISCQQQHNTAKNSKPNIIVVYVDDLGFGDIGCYGAKGVTTPNIDKLAQNGIQLNTGYASAATCTPSRYSLLTGMYAFRNNAAILPGDAPLLISTKTPTLPGMLKKNGYKTAAIGKWHLGLGDGKINWNEEIKPGPLEIGFDYSFLIPATGDRVPCVFVENHRVANLDPADPISVSYTQMVGDWPTGVSNPEMLKVKADLQHSNTIVNGVSRIGFMTGGKKALWVDEEFPFVLTNKAKEFITENKKSPFFLYFAYHDIHVPRIVNPKFVGKSSMGARGDAIAQMDWCTGEIMKTLDSLGIADNTLIFFSSDNGPVLADGYDDRAVEMVGVHQPTGKFRGGKYSAYEGGTRVPTIVYWPKTIKPGISNGVFNQIDLYASFASLIGQNLEENEAVDSHNLIDLLTGKNDIGRTEMIEESFVLSLRSGNMKYITAGTKAPDWMKNKNIESGLQTTPQLFDLEKDINEQNNIIDSLPDIAKQMELRIKTLKENGRSR